MTRDLESALREAREFVRIAAERAALRSVEDEGLEENRIRIILVRIDAALSAASGDRAKLKGDPDVDDYIRKGREKQARIVKGLHEYPLEGGSPPASGGARERERERILRELPTIIGKHGANFTEIAAAIRAGAKP